MGLRAEVLDNVTSRLFQVQCSGSIGSRAQMCKHLLATPQAPTRMGHLKVVPKSRQQAEMILSGPVRRAHLALSDQDWKAPLGTWGFPEIGVCHFAVPTIRTVIRLRVPLLWKLPFVARWQRQGLEHNCIDSVEEAKDFL